MRRLIDDHLPVWDQRERHETLIRATPEAIDAAMRELTPGDLPLTRFLFAIRTRRLRPGGTPLFEGMLAQGFGVLVDRPCEEMVLGACGRPWRSELDGFDGPGGFAAYDRPGSMRAVMNFALEPEGDATRLTTETRILSTDDAARRTFARYWLVVMPGSALIRRELLWAVRRAAESA